MFQKQVKEKIIFWHMFSDVQSLVDWYIYLEEHHGGRNRWWKLVFLADKKQRKGGRGAYEKRPEQEIDPETNSY